MDEIEKYIEEENMEWFKKQTPKSIACIINAFKRVYVSETQIVCSKEQRIIENEIKQSCVAPLIGQKGEKDVREILKSTNLWILDEKKTKSKSGDIKAKPCYDILSSKYPLMVEVKNYKNNVPYAEVEKFHRDLHNNIEYTMGLFISIDRKICNIDSDIYYETKLINGKYRFLVYLTFLDEQILKVVSEVLLFQYANNEKINESHIVQLNQLFESIKLFHNLKTQMENMKDNINEMILTVDRLYCEMESSINKIKMKPFITIQEFDSPDSFKPKIKKFIKKINYEGKFTLNDDILQFGEIRINLSTEIVKVPDSMNLGDKFLIHDKMEKYMAYNIIDLI